MTDIENEILANIDVACVATMINIRKLRKRTALSIGVYHQICIIRGAKKKK